MPRRLLLRLFSGVNKVGYKEVNRKLHVLKESLNKMEHVCYNIKVRGSEVPEHMLLFNINQKDNDEAAVDEGYF